MVIVRWISSLTLVLSAVGSTGYGLSHIKVVETRAGEIEDFSIQAVDIYQNPKQLNDDSWYHPLPCSSRWIARFSRDQCDVVLAGR
jgi:hypothetical protein